MAITEQQVADLVPLLTGEVEDAFEITAELSNLFTAEPLRGSDTKIDRVVGKSHVETVDWTEDDKHSQVGTFGTITYKVEQSIYIRHAEKNISALLNDVDALKELGEEHGKALAEQRDVTILTALLIGSRQAAMASSGVAGVAVGDELDKTVLEGLHGVLAATGDINDVAKVEDKLEQLIISQRARRKLGMGAVMVVSHGVYNLLRQSDKLISKDFSTDNGDYAKGTVGLFLNIPVMPVTTFQDLQTYAGTVNPIGATWNTTTTDAEARAVIFTPRAIRVLEVMPVTVDAWYEKAHKNNYIDSQAFYGVGVRRQDYIAALYTFEAIVLGTTDNLVAAIDVV